MTFATVYGNVNAILGLPGSCTYLSGTVRFALLPPLRTNVTPVWSDSLLKVPMQLDFDVQYDGSFSACVPSNDSIRPDGTSYKVLYLIPNISFIPRAYTINGPGPFDISQICQEDW